MSLTVSFETDWEFGFSAQEVGERVLAQTLLSEGVSLPCQASLLVTGAEQIKELNRDFRGIDSVTDVLSFPAYEFETPGDMAALEEKGLLETDPETGDILLGDIAVCTERIKEQALEYGHSEEREYAFLIAHSLLHLLGYDHQDSEQETVMFEKQSSVLEALGITRDL